MFAPQIDTTEALRRVVQHFGECIGTGKTPLTDGHCGLRTVSVLEAATRSMKGHGQLQPVATGATLSATV